MIRERGSKQQLQGVIRGSDEGFEAPWGVIRGPDKGVEAPGE